MRGHHTACRQECGSAAGTGAHRAGAGCLGPPPQTALCGGGRHRSCLASALCSAGRAGRRTGSCPARLLPDPEPYSGTTSIAPRPPGRRRALQLPYWLLRPPTRPNRQPGLKKRSSGQIGFALKSSSLGRNERVLRSGSAAEAALKAEWLLTPAPGCGRRGPLRRIERKPA